MQRNQWNWLKTGVMIACAVALFVGMVQPTAMAKNTAPSWTTEKSWGSPEEMLRIVNQERQKAGKKPLVLSDELTRAANIRARELTEVFSHTRPDGTPFHTVLGRGQGRYTLGENAAAGSATVEAVMIQWMDSPGHRQNILEGRFREMGVGHFYAEDSVYKHYWIQIFQS